jgi:hypothetical protein
LEREPADGRSSDLVQITDLANSRRNGGLRNRVDIP